MCNRIYINTLQILYIKCIKIISKKGMKFKFGKDYVYNNLLFVEKVILSVLESPDMII